MKARRTPLMILTGLGILLAQCPDSRKPSPFSIRPEPVVAAPVAVPAPESIAQEIVVLRDACLRALSLRGHELSESEITNCRQYDEKAAGSLAAQHDRYWRLINLLLYARGLGHLHTHADAR